MAEEIKISCPLGVSGVVPSTRILARIAADNRPTPGKALDLGTGSGYIAIYMAQKGFKVDATDISDLALKTAISNAMINGVNVNIFKSNFFENVSGRYDLIVWNAPVGDSGGNHLFDFVKSIVRAIPFLYRVAQRIAYKLFLKERTRIDKHVLEQSGRYLEPGGILAMILIDGEKEILVSAADELGFNSDIIETREFRKSMPGYVAVFTKRS